VQAAFNLAKQEGIIPALESAHALSALNQLFPTPGGGGREETVVLCLSGRGDKDLGTYMKYIK
jgi:tryptophan synthase beta chain